MPRISGRSSLTTTSDSRLRPSERSVSRWFCLPPMPDLICVTLRRPMSGPRSCASAQQGGRGDVLDRQATAGRDLLGTHETLQGRHGRVDDVDRVGRPERLRQHVVDAGALEHGTHRATGDDAGTGAGGLEQHDTGRRLTLVRVGDGALDARDLEEVLLGLLHALGDGGRHLLGLAVADAHRAVAVADDDERREAEPATTLDDLGDAVDRDDALDVLRLLGRGPTPVATVATLVAAAGRRSARTRSAAALRTWHQTFLFSVFIRSFI